MKKLMSRIGLALLSLLVVVASLAFASPAQATPFNGAGYYYVQASQTFTGTDYVGGLSANAYVAKPFVPATVYGGARDHSLIALGISRTTTALDDAVEVGIAVAHDQFGDDNPHLYSCAWHAGSPVTGCWTGTGGPWVDDTGNATNLGTDLTADIGTAKQIQVYQSTLDCGLSANGWHVYYNGSHVGCWQPTAFTAGWSTVKYVQSFGEYAYNGANNSGTSNDKPCGDMGLGGTPGVGQAYVGSLSIVNPSPGTLTTSFSLGAVTDSSAYDIAFASGSTRTFYYGKSGYKFVSGVATTPGNIGSC
jgi:hypothetical protein